MTSTPGVAAESDLDGDRIIPFHLLGGEAGSLRGDFQNDRRRIRIGFDIQPAEGEQASAEKHQEAHQHQRTTRQAECQKALQHV